MDERLFPAEGHVSVPCARCRWMGGQRVEHRLEYADPPEGGWPPGVDAARLAVACRACGSDFLSVEQRLTLDPAGRAADMPWLTCEVCGVQAAGRRWPWLACGGCGAEDRARVHGG